MANHFVPSVAKRKGYDEIELSNKPPTKIVQGSVHEVGLVFFGPKPKLSEKKERFTVTLKRMVDPNELHRRLNEVIPGTDVECVGPSSFQTDFVFITLPKTMRISEFQSLANGIMEDL